MVSLLGHAHEGRTPQPTSWLLSVAVAVGTLALIPASHALADFTRLSAAYRPLYVAMPAGAVMCALIGWAAPAPWVLAVLLVLVLSLTWAVAARGFLLAGAWDADEGRRDPEEVFPRATGR